MSVLSFSIYVLNRLILFLLYPCLSKIRSSTQTLDCYNNKLKFIYHFAYVALSCGAFSVVPDAIECVLSPRLRYCLSMLHVDTYFHLTVESPRPHSRAPVPKTEIQSSPTSPNTRRRSYFVQLIDNFIEQMSQVHNCFGHCIH